MSTPQEREAFRLVVVSAGTSDPSSTRLLADRTAQRVTELAATRGHTVTVSAVDLREIATDITTALVSQLVTAKLQKVITALGEADGIIAAAPEDWSDPALNKRIDRAAVELVLLMESGFARKIKDESWQSYQHEYGSAGGTEVDIDLDTDLMRLATGGSAG